jgi:enoyl-CoA hydratase/carnithine racemase
MITDLLDVDLPIVCAVNGPAVGLGASLALLCDVVFIADTATISDPHVRAGIVAGDGGAVIWPLLVGPARAKEYLLTSDPLTAAEAERIGLVNRVVAADELDAEAAWVASSRMIQHQSTGLACMLSSWLIHVILATNRLCRTSLSMCARRTKR